MVSPYLTVSRGYRLPVKHAATWRRAVLGRAQPLSERDAWIAAQVGPELQDKGLLFVGLDIIGDYLTEINVTSPTCIREIDAAYDLDIGGKLMDCIVEKLQPRG